jgi:myosin tail region-interacting protein MTI1
MLFRVKALYEYSSPHEDDLSFPQGQVISVTEEEDADWYVGEYVDAAGVKQAGLFPKNFVEKFEPEMPPRPTRPTRHKQPEAPLPADEPPADEHPVVAATSPVIQSPVQEKHLPTPSEAPQVEPKETLSPPPPQPVAASKPVPPPSSPQPAAKASAPPPAPSAKVPPAVAEKPSSFKDRIAAFNKPAAAPITPFKSGGAPSTFIKKPFVAPPPSRNAYVPPPTRNVPQAQVYRREEDPEIAERRAQDQENAERAGLTVSANQEEGEDAPKPTSLKERIALLQKQQMEQARRAEASHKEKPKRPPKKRTESHEKQETQADDEAANVDTTGSVSSDISREVARPPAPRKPSHGPQTTEVLSDANDADQSAAGETTEDAEGTSTSVEEEDDRKARAAQVPTQKPTSHEPAEEEEGESTEDEEDEIDEETRRRMELRERMAKMSGGMGMAGMFGPPGGLPMGMPSQKKKKAPPPPERKPTEESAPSHQPARIAMIPVPGMAQVRSQEPEDRQLAAEEETEEPAAITSHHRPGEVPDIETVKRRTSSMTSHDKPAQSPVDGKQYSRICFSAVAPEAIAFLGTLRGRGGYYLHLSPNPSGVAETLLVLRICSRCKH